MDFENTTGSKQADKTIQLQTHKNYVLQVLHCGLWVRWEHLFRMFILQRLKKMKCNFFFFFPTDTIHKDHVIWYWTVSFIFLFAKIFFFFFPDMFKNVSIFQEGWFHGFPWISRREYKWRKQQPSRLLWLIVIMKRFTEKVGYTCLLIVCFFAQISRGQEISEREPNSNTIYICSW